MPDTTDQLVPGLDAAVAITLSSPAEATIPAAALWPGDVIELSPSTPAVRIEWLATSVPYPNLLLIGIADLPHPLTLPQDSRYRLIEGLRRGTVTCLLCKRAIPLLFNLAANTPAGHCICTACDAEVTARVMAEVQHDAQDRHRDETGQGPRT